MEQDSLEPIALPHSDPRKERGLALVQGKGAKIKHVIGTVWHVPSQTANGGYVVDAEKATCSCPDFETRGERCKHRGAVLYVRREVAMPDGTTIVSESVHKISSRHRMPNSADDHGITAVSTVTVTDHSLTGLDVSPYAATIFPKGVANLVATLRFKDGTSTDVTTSAVWSSSDPKVAEVKAGTAVGIAPGTAIITATASSLSGKSTITVTAAP